APDRRCSACSVCRARLRAAVPRCMPAYRTLYLARFRREFHGMAIASTRLHRNRQGRARAMSTTPHSGSDREIQQELERAKSEASHLASSTMDTAKQRGREAVDRAKDKAADRAEDFASAVETTAEDLETSEGGEMLSGYGRSMAELMRRFAGGLRENEIEEFAGQLADFARRNPASFLAGSVAIGFGVSRFLKATSTRSLEQYGYDDEEEDPFDFDEERSFHFENAETKSPE